MEKKVEQGAYIKGEEIYLAEDGKVTQFCSVHDVPIPGRHNIQNTLAALILGRRMGATIENLTKTLKKFKGVEHRCEPVGTSKNGVQYVNDSKATNVDSLEKALLAYEKPIILIAGGKDRDTQFDRVNSLIREKVKKLVVLGEAKPKILKNWGSLVETHEAGDIEEAVKVAAGIAEEGDIVLLSPACASWDQFSSYEDRGMAFKKFVRNVLEA